jgi:hypothetical protein
MGDTIRDYIKRRVQWGFGIAFASWLFLAITASFSGPRPGFLPFFGILGFMGAIVSFLFIRCPKCGARLGQTIAIQTGMRLTRWSPKVKYCPFCGVSLDEPMPPGR